MLWHRAASKRNLILDINACEVKGVVIHFFHLTRHGGGVQLVCELVTVEYVCARVCVSL